MHKSLIDYHPDSKSIIDKYYSLLMSEADRGIILLGVSIIDEQLTDLFKSISPSSLSKTESRKIFDSRGAFGELSSKLDIALVCNLLPKNIIDSVHKLRKFRNGLAHNPAPFSLKDNLDKIFDVFTTLDKNAPACFLDISKGVVYENYINQMMELNSFDDSSAKLFNSKEEVLIFLNDKPDIWDVLMEKRIKALFVTGVSTITALIIYHREKLRNN